MTPFIRDLIDLPERVHEGDFVLNLSAGVLRPEETLRDYVVTPQLARCFDDALGFVKSAVDSKTSKAAYLHGSFGAGKSHFMAVLHLLLQHNLGARAIPELNAVIATHPWTEGKKFLLVPYHLIGARSMETALLGGYVDFVRQAHPTAPMPAVYPATEIFDNAQKTRAIMGDETFFSELNRVARHAGQTPGRWGKLEGGWTPESFERVAGVAPLSEAVSQKQSRGESLSEAEALHVSLSHERTRLIGQLITVFFPAYQGVASVKDEAYVPLDQGLSIISQHARDLGYDAVVLFLDELVLWLASRAADVAFVHREGQKLAKLVESQRPDRPIPIISFVARQRDLRELVGERLTGSEQLNFADALRHWEGRFHKITLEDRNLATITEKRVLRPKSEAARQVLRSAFDRTLTARREVIDTLCTASGDHEMFRQVYPFTPALIQTLVALSSALQRHRTALKLLLLLLVQQRETLQLGQVIPVGDLWDVLDEREKALTEVLESSFKKARTLYTQKLRPVLKAEHALSEDETRYQTTTDPLLRRQWEAFRNDERLAKTLLLAALVPEVEALKELTAGRLAALNYGSVTSPIPGREAQLVLNKVRSWAAQVGEIRIGEGNNPTLSIKLTGVDTEGLLERVREQDNPGNRQRKVRELLFAELGIPDVDGWLFERNMLWRGLVRGIDVVYGNVRTFGPETFQNRGDRWKLILDYPFDEPGFTPAFDKAKIDEFKRLRPQGALTVVWLPRFLSLKAQQDLGTLVLLDYLLKGDNFDRNATYLQQVERAEARALVANQRSALHTRVKQHLEAAYGIAAPKGDAVDTSYELDEPFYALIPTLAPRIPGVGSLKDALEGVMDQALSVQFPSHPRFTEEVKTAALKKTLEVVQLAARADQHRVPVDRTLRRTIESIAHPLKLGQMAETHFILGTAWRDQLERRRHEAKLETVSVRQLRAWLDPEDEPSGLSSGATKEIANLIILTWAEQTNRLFFLHGGPVTPTLEKLEDDVVLREQLLPSLEEWRNALVRSGGLFGVQGSPLLNATNMAQWTTAVRQGLNSYREATRVPSLLMSCGERLGIDAHVVAKWPRLQTAEEAASLMRLLLDKEDVPLVRALAAYQPEHSNNLLSRSLGSSQEVVSILGQTSWDLITAAGHLDDARQQAGKMLVEDVVGYLRQDELVQSLKPKLEDAQRRALRLLTDVPKRVESEKERLEREARERQEREQALKRKQEAEAREEALRLQRLEAERLERERLAWERQERERRELEDQKRKEKELEARLEKEREQAAKRGGRLVTSTADINSFAEEVASVLKRHPDTKLRLVWQVEE